MKQKLYWLSNNLEEVLGAILLFSMATLAFLNVLTRYFIQYSFAFTEEIEVAAMVWLTMLGVAAAFKHKLHLRLMYLDTRVSAKNKLRLELFALLCSLFLFSLIAYLGYYHVIDLIELEVTSEALEIPEYIYVLIIPIGCALINLRIIVLLLDLIKQLRT